MKVFILIHKKHGHLVDVYADKEKCTHMQKYLNTIFENNDYEIIEKILL